MSRQNLLVIHERMGYRGGAEQYIACVVPELKKNYSVRLLYETQEKKGVTEWSNLFHTCYQADFDDVEAIEDALTTLNPDLIYVHKCLSTTLFERILSRSLPVVHHVHDHESYCMRGYKYFPWSRKICTHKAGKCCLFPCLAFVQKGMTYVSYGEKQRLIQLDQKCDGFVAVSNYMKEELIRQGFAPDKITVIPPVPTELPTAEERMAADPPVILFTGQILRGKGLDCLIRALAMVKSPFKLRVIGEGSHRAVCEALVKQLHLDQKVEFLGFISRRELTKHYRDAVFGVVPSVWPEPFSFVGLEFMHLGLPVIAFDSGGISDWLEDGETGYLVPWMNVDALSARVEELLADPLKSVEMGRKAKQRVEEKFAFSTTVEHLEQYLRRIGSCGS